ISIDSLVKGDIVRITSRSKGKGFAGSVKRWGFAGGPASHGSKFHRQPGSSGNRTWPGRVMPGKKFPGHLGDETVTVRNVRVVDVLAAEGVVLVKGPVPGSRNTLVKLVKE
ncbi:MAG: 50S ribosomal protein L3, partial [Proteobacteria bacterium]